MRGGSLRAERVNGDLSPFYGIAIVRFREEKIRDGNQPGSQSGSQF
jgi:hypothetical protein